MSQLFTPLEIRGCTFRNRIFVSPMCQYSADEGMPNDWHLVHLGSRATGGAGLVLTEATAVSAIGRISPGDLGLWNEAQRAVFQRIVRFIQDQGARAGVQLAHAGRKASTGAPWSGREGLKPEKGGWGTLGPSAINFDSAYVSPRAMELSDIQSVIEQFVRSTELAAEAGFDVIELHMAHGYLMHEFLSPLSNTRTDNYGGSPENRMRLSLEVARAVRATWDKPLFVRVSATDWVEGGWDVEQTVVLARELRKCGVDLIDASTGGLVPNAKIPVGPGYQVPFAERIKHDAGILTGAVGMIHDAHQAEDILGKGQADAVLLARELLRDPHWPIHAAEALGVPAPWPRQYARAARSPRKQ